MKRSYKKSAVFDVKRLSKLAFTLFVVFIAYKILTPPSNFPVQAQAPDGSKTARLKTSFYYDNQPSYKVYYRETGKRIWLALYYLPVYTNAPIEIAQPDLQWSETSDRLDFLMNGTSIWHHSFSE